MIINASFEKIQKVEKHPYADQLDIVTVSNFPCVVRHEEFKENDLVFYIREDSKLFDYDGFEKQQLQEREAKRRGEATPVDVYNCKFPWQEPLLKYLGSGGRVKTIKLRGKVSMGIILKPEIVSGKNSPSCCYQDITENNYQEINSCIFDKEKGVSFIETNFGITHWEAPINNFGTLNTKYQGLPFSMERTDSENWENLEESDLHLGELCLVTRKYDGSSTTTTCYPNGEHEISSRNMTFNNTDKYENMNAYQKLTQNIVKAGLWWAKKYNKVIAFRSESCCGAFNKSSYNKCCTLNDSFIFECTFPEEENFFIKRGVYGTYYHFLNIVRECNEAGFNLKTVDILEKDVVITKELLKKYNDAPYTDGEGVVINVKVRNMNEIPSSLVWHYKSKSREYLMKMK